MATLLTFYDFTFRAQHSLEGRSEAAAHPHWHTYTVRLWFDDAPDQDELSRRIEKRFNLLHGSSLPEIISDSTDEGIALYFLGCTDCTKVRVTNDGRRGAEASR